MLGSGIAIQTVVLVVGTGLTSTRLGEYKLPVSRYCPMRTTPTST